MSPIRRNLKILMVSPQYLPLLGGYERACERLSKRLVQIGHRVTIVTERRNKNWARFEISEGVHVKRLWTIFRPRLHSVTTFVSFLFFFLRHGRKFDIWHVHQYGSLAAVAIALGKLLNRPVVLKITSSGSHGISSVTKTSPLPRVVCALLRRADAVVALTKETEKEALTFGIRANRIFRIGNGVETGKFRPLIGLEKEQLKAQLNMTENIVMSVGRLIEQKNPDGLLRAWAMTHTRLSRPWKLVLVGDGNMRQRLLELTKELEIADSVLFAGAQTNVQQWLGCADIYVSTSHCEGLSNTLLEAMATGLPISATRVSGVPELVEDTNAGFVADIASMEQVAQALIAQCENEALRHFQGRNSRTVIVDRFSIEKVAELYEHLYIGLKS
jgi:glycosyltransferase involved in cell wall biosynthesis